MTQRSSTDPLHESILLHVGQISVATQTHEMLFYVTPPGTTI